MKTLVVPFVGAALLSIAAAASGVSPSVPVLNWGSCGVPGGYQCAVAPVPLDYDDPQGAMTGIVLARYPAADPANRIGTVFVNFGGPGVSGVATLIQANFGEVLGTLLQGRFDVVAFDPRGVGYSTPLQCFDTVEERAAYFAGLPRFPYRDDQERSYFDRFSSLASVCRGRGQPIATHMSTADVVRDLDLLRQAVGDEGLTYLGFSYGSYIGNTYANLFPDRVRALAIDGVIDPLIWAIGRQISSDRVATQQEADEFFRLCDEAAAIHPAYCPASGPDGAASRQAVLAERLKLVPLVLPDGSLYTYDRLVADSAGCMYTPENWPACAQVLNFLELASRGDPTAIQQAAAARQAVIEPLRAADAGRAYNNQFDASFAVLCADTQYRSPFAAYAALDGWTGKGSIYGPFWWWPNAGCADWPLSPDRYAGPWTADTAAPVLVIGNYFDGVTDYAGALASQKFLKNSRLLSYAGWGHTAFQRSDCARFHAVRYLFDGTLPPEGTVCPANPNPFLPVAAAAPSSAQQRATEVQAPSVGLPALWPGD